MKKIISMASVCFIFLFVLANSVFATEITVCSSGCDYTIIQNAVGNASSGDIINVSAGTYDEQIVIDKSLTVQGTGDDTIIKPSSATILSQVFTGLFWYGGTKNVAGIIVANVSDGSNVTIKNLKIDESDITTKPTGSDYLTGIFYRETGGVIDNLNITGGGAWSGTDRAYGIFLSAVTNTVSIEVKNSIIANFDKNGIEVMGDQLTANIHNNVITGRGSISDEVQNGINVGRNAVGIVNYNTISNLAYQPASSLSAGILFYHYVSPTGKNAITIGNIVTNCQIGIIFKNANSSAQDNIVSGGTVGLDGIFSQPNYANAYTASFINNTISNVTNRSAIDAETYSTLTPPNGATLIATIINNTLITGYGTADGIYIGGGAGGVIATISGNAISGFGEYGINLGDARASGATITGNTISNNLRGVNVGTGVNASNVNANLNNIAENQNYNIYNGGLGILNAETNWWGSATPDISKFYGNLTYYPFCLNVGCSLNIENETNEFGGNTTNFSNITDWSNVTLILDAGEGTINWENNVNLTGSNLKFDSYIGIIHNRISIDSNNMPELNEPATLTFKNAGYTDINHLSVKRNGITCPDVICSNIRIEGNNVLVDANQMSDYWLEDSVYGSLPSITGQLVVSLGFGIMGLFAILTLLGFGYLTATGEPDTDTFIKIIVSIVIIILAIVAVWQGIVI